MKICVVGISGVAVGKHNLKDPKLDQADKLVEAKKKVYVQVDVLPEENLAEAEGILVQSDRWPDLLLQDLEFVEMRLGREPQEAEKAALLNARTALEAEKPVRSLSEADRQALAGHVFITAKPTVVVRATEGPAIEEELLHLYHDAGYISFLTLGGKENRAWMIRQGETAWEAAASIHSDIQKGFIRAEVIGFQDLADAGGEVQAKRAGKLRLETKQYVLQDGDVVNFRFNK